VAKILVTFALSQESLFERKLTRRVVKQGLTLGQLGAHEIAVFRLGLGAQDKDGFKRVVKELSSELVINSGFAGAVRTLLEPGDFVLAENFSSPELSNWLGRTRIFAASGSFAAVNEIADSAAKARLNSQSNIIAVDMESAQVAALCSELAVSYVSAKMISDRYDEQIPAILLGKKIRRMRDLSDTIWFASRMLVLRQKLADRLVELISVVGGHKGRIDGFIAR
jgi:nucleoside phosphorylase